MKNLQSKKAQQIGRKAFLRQKREQESKTDKALAASEATASVMLVRTRVGGRARKVRRG